MGVACLHAQERALSEPDRIVAGNAGPAGPGDPALGPATWLWHQPRHPQSVGRGLSGGYRLSLSRTAPAGEAEVDLFRVEALRKQAEGQSLPVDGAGAAAGRVRTFTLATVPGGGGGES